MKSDIRRILGGFCEAALSSESWPKALGSLTRRLGAVGAAYKICNKQSRTGLAASRQITQPELPAVQSPSSQPGTPSEQRLGAPAMACEQRRYYFHVRNGEIYRDDNGTCFSTDEEAIIYGSQVAHELMEEGGWNGYDIAITDESGSEITRLRIAR